MTEGRYVQRLLWVTPPLGARGPAFAARLYPPSPFGLWHAFQQEREGERERKKDFIGKGHWFTAAKPWSQSTTSSAPATPVARSSRALFASSSVTSGGYNFEPGAMKYIPHSAISKSSLDKLCNQPWPRSQQEHHVWGAAGASRVGCGSKVLKET